MPSPFPGMDPYLEGPEWPTFHGAFNFEMAARLTAALRPHYAVRAEQRIYLDEDDDDEGDRDVVRVPDALVFRELRDRGGERRAATTADVAAPVICVTPEPIRRMERYLVLRHLSDREVVTVIETLSPANKRRNGAGRRHYLRKREELLDGPTHLVEIDLLRGGDRMPFRGEAPPLDHLIAVSRAPDRPRCEIYPNRLPEPLPRIPIPLKEGDGDTSLDLQAVLAEVYDRVGFDLTLNYANPPRVPFTAEQRAWARTLPGVTAGDDPPEAVEA